MSKKEKKIIDRGSMEDAAKALRKGDFSDEGIPSFDIGAEIHELEKDFVAQNQDIPTEDLIPISRFTAFKSFISGLFRQTSNPEIVVSFNGKTFSLNRHSDTYAGFLKCCPGEENVLEQILLDEMKAKDEPKQESDPNWDAEDTEPTEKMEVVETDFQTIPSPKISFCGGVVSSNIPCNQIDPEQIVGRPDPRSLPVLTEEQASEFFPDSGEEPVKDKFPLNVVCADESNQLKSSECVEKDGKSFFKSE